MSLILAKPAGQKLTLAKGQPVPNDPYLYTNTVLLLHGDGANGSTNIVDSSRVAGSPKIVTPVGNAQISTAVADPFGNSARGVLAFDGSGDYLTVPDSPGFQFGSTDFTIEFWVYPNNNNSWWILGKGNAATAAGSAFSFYNGAGGTWDFYYGSSSVAIPRPSLTVSTWQHIAVVRNGSIISIYKGGSLTSNGSIGANSINSAATSPVQIGFYALSGFNGYIDELRITKGVARYTSNFTPPTAPFPDF